MIRDTNSELNHNQIADQYQVRSQLLFRRWGLQIHLPGIGRSVITCSSLGINCLQWPIIISKDTTLSLSYTPQYLAEVHHVSRNDADNFMPVNNRRGISNCAVIIPLVLVLVMLLMMLVMLSSERRGLTTASLGMAHSSQG